MDSLNERIDKLLDMDEDEFIEWLEVEVNLDYNFGSEAAKITAEIGVILVMIRRLYQASRW